MDKAIVKIAVCDDNKRDRTTIIDALSSYFTENRIIYQIDIFESGEDLLKADHKEYLLVLLDIFMEELDGIETAKHMIRSNQKTKIIFLSSSREYALESYDVNALYYLLKPIDKVKLYGILDVFLESITKMKVITVKIGRQKQSIPLKDIIYVEAQGKRSILHLKKEQIEVSMSLAELEKMLPMSEFVRPIRWAIVPLCSIIKVPLDELVLSDKTIIQISRKERENVKQRYIDYKLKR